MLLKFPIRRPMLWLVVAVLPGLLCALRPAVGQLPRVRTRPTDAPPPGGAPVKPASPPATGPDAASRIKLPDANQPVQVVLLRNGEMLRGRTTSDSETCWIYPTEGGRIALPNHQIAKVAADTHQVYRYLASQIAPGDTVARERLVQWCLRHNELDLAELELRQLAQLSRRDEEIQSLRRRLASKRETVNAPPPSVQPVARTRKVEKRDLTPVANVSPEALAVFTRQIQPLLGNSCATSRCHGRATTTQFKVIRPSRGFHTTKRMTQENLENVLRQLDMVTPGNSPLLHLAKTPHGGASEPLGLYGTPKYDRLQAWVVSVAGPIRPPAPTAHDVVQAAPSPSPSPTATELSGNATAHHQPGSPSTADSPAMALLKSSMASETPATVDRDRAFQAIPSGRSGQGAPETRADQRSSEQRPDATATDATVDQESAIQGVDPFDPHVFNARFGSAPDSGRE